MISPRRSHYRSYPQKIYTKALFASFYALLLVVIIPAGFAQTNDDPLVPIVDSEIIRVTGIQYPHFFWLEGEVELTIDTDQAVTLTIGLINGEIAAFDTSLNQVSLVEGQNSVTVPLKLGFSILPGEYDFYIGISDQPNFSVNVYLSQEFTVRIGLGLPTLLLSIGILIAGVALIIIKRQKGGSSATSTTVTTTIPTGTAPVSPAQSPMIQNPNAPPTEAVPAAPAGKIKCPQCKKIIAEGSVFCPECGERIPAFYRFNPGA